MTSIYAVDNRRKVELAPTPGVAIYTATYVRQNRMYICLERNEDEMQLSLTVDQVHELAQNLLDAAAALIARFPEENS